MTPARAVWPLLLALISASTAPALVLAQEGEPLATAATGPVWLGYVLLFLVVGVVTFRALILPKLAEWPALRPALLARTRLLAILAASLLLAELLIRLYLQARGIVGDDQGVSWALVRPILSQTLWGRGWSLQMVFALLLTSAFLIEKHTPLSNWTERLCAMGLLVVTPLTGHAVEHPWGAVVGVALHFVHLAGGSLWLGTLAVLTASLVRLDDLPAEALAVAVDRFSPFALIGAALAVGAGVLLGWVYSGGITEVLNSAYGITLLVKLALVAVVALVGWYNWKRVRPALAAQGPTRLRRSAVIELVLGTLLLAATAVLVALAAPGLGMG